MPVIRIDAQGSDPVLHANPRPLRDCLAATRHLPGPAIVMVHGLKYAPGHGIHCPHRTLFALAGDASGAPGWPRGLGFGVGDPQEGLAVSFGWPARTGLRQALSRSGDAALALARVVAALRDAGPDRPVHLMAHSLGATVALDALAHLRAGDVARIVTLSGAAFSRHAEAALATPAGRSAELINVTSRENDLFDFLFEICASGTIGSGHSLGQGIDAPNAITLQMDCPGTLAHLARLGRPVAPPGRRVCHWSSYTRAGVMDLYAALLRDPGGLPLALLRRGLPARPAPRWSRLLAVPRLPRPPALPFARNAS